MPGAEATWSVRIALEPETFGQHLVVIGTVFKGCVLIHRAATKSILQLRDLLLASLVFRPIVLDQFVEANIARRGR